MMKVKHLFSGMLAMLAVLLLTGCYWNHWNDNPVRTSLEIESTDLVLSVGESVTRSATTESRDYEFTYTSSNPAVATVDQNGKVTARDAERLVCRSLSSVQGHREEPLSRTAGECR